LEYRIKMMAKAENIPEFKARTLVQNLDAGRESFFHRYWPQQTLAPEIFHITLNSGLMQEEQMVDGVLPLIKPLLNVLV